MADAQETTVDSSEQLLLIRRAKIAVAIALVLFMITDLLLVVILVELAEVQVGRVVGVSLLEGYVAAYLYRLFAGIWALASMIAFWVWSTRLARNWPDTGELRVGSLVWAWLIPGVNAILPFILLRRLWARETAAVRDAGEDWKRLRPSWHWVACWSVFVGSVLVLVVSRLFQIRTAGVTPVAVYAEAMGRFGLVVVAGFALVYVLRVTRAGRTRVSRSAAG